MEIVDEFKNKEYFLKKLESLNNYIDEEKINFKNGKIKIINRYYIVLSSDLLEKIELLKKLSEKKEKIKELVEEYCDVTEKITGDISYNQLKSILSLAYLYNLNIEKVEFIKKKISGLGDKYIDAPLDMLINSVFIKKAITSKDYCFKLTLNDSFKKTDKEFMNIVNAKNQEERNIAFVEYLNTVKEKFYRKQLKEYEEISEDRYTYTGSCDFMLTALAKLFKIDKKLLEKSKFIAADLL